MELTSREAFKIGNSAVRLTDTILGFVEQDLSETLREIASEIGVGHIACLRFAPDKSLDTSLLGAIVTYSKEWQLRYFVKQYVKIDPVITYGRIALKPFDWEILGDGDPAVLAFFADAVNHGVGRNGLSIPVRSRRGVFSLVSFSSSHPRSEWERYKSNNTAELQVISCLIESAANVDFKLPVVSIKLSRREEQCLILAARGKTYQDIKDILDLTFGSVKTHLDSARRKLHCVNLTHAVAVAIATGAIPARCLSNRGRAEGEDCGRGVARAGDSERFGGTLPGSPEPDPCVEEAAFGERGAGVRSHDRDGRGGGIGARDREAARQDRPADD